MSQFGQPPLAAYLPLRAGQNLSDLPDKTASLANLGTLSSSDIMLNSVPIGTIISYWGNTAPVGYLPCSGQTVNSGTFPDLVTFLGGGSSQALPDLRGEFLRGWDNGRGVDTGRAIKTWQSDAFASHNHGIAGSLASATGSFSGNPMPWSGTGTWNTGNTGGTETRPRNLAVLYCMKAYGALINTTTANMGNVLTELSQCTKLTQFGSSLASPGYQRLPSGLIIQWGSSTSSGTTGGNVSFTYPVAFPSGTLAGSCVVGGVASGTPTVQWGGGSTLLATATAASGGTIASGLSVLFVVIGY